MSSYLSFKPRHMALQPAKERGHKAAARAEPWRAGRKLQSIAESCTAVLPHPMLWATEMKPCS